MAIRQGRDHLGLSLPGTDEQLYGLLHAGHAGIRNQTYLPGATGIYRKLTPLRANGRVYAYLFYILLPVALSLLALAACNRGEDAAWQRIQDRGILRVGLDPTYPPFETADDGALRGIDVDMARALGNELGLDVEFLYFGYDGLYDALATEQVDVLISALVIRPEQTGDFAYSEPYFNGGQILIAPRQENGLSEMADLEGQTLSVELGARGHVVATDWEKRLPNLNVEPYNTPQAALDAVVTGDADAVLIDAISGCLFLANNADLEIVGEPVTVEPYAMVVRKENERLLDELNAALAQLEESGQLENIINRWMARADP